MRPSKLLPIAGLTLLASCDPSAQPSATPSQSGSELRVLSSYTVSHELCAGQSGVCRGFLVERSDTRECFLYMQRGAAIALAAATCK